jgi:hypothetical protein
MCHSTTLTVRASGFQDRPRPPRGDPLGSEAFGAALLQIPVAKEIIGRIIGLIIICGD